VASPLAVGEAFVLFLVALGYVPAVRAYSVEREDPWLVAGYSALLVGRVAAVAGTVTRVDLLLLLEHGVGIALAAVCFVIHFWIEWRVEGDRDRSEPLDRALADGD